MAAAVATAVLVLSLTAALAADRLLNGSATSNISGYLPAGAAFYLEVPSVRRWARGLTQVEFLDSEAWDADEILRSLTETMAKGEPDVQLQTRLLAFVDTFAVAIIDGERLQAIHHDNEEAMLAHLASLGNEVRATQWGPRYRSRAGDECLWVANDQVEICGAKKALEKAVQVLDGRAPSAEEDAYLQAAKTRRLWSYLPFFEVPALYSIGSRELFEKNPAFEHLSGATATAVLDEKGFVEKVDFLWLPGKAPRAFAPPAQLTLWRELPEGTLAYFNYRANYPKNRQDFESEFSTWFTPPPGAPTTAELMDQIQDLLGFHPSALSQGWGPEGLIAATFAPQEPLTPKNGATPAGALLLLQTIDDHTKLRQTLSALVEHLSKDRAALFWKDEHNLIGSGPGDVRIHLRLEKGLFRLGIGVESEVTRIFESPAPLTNGPAHETGIDFDQELSALGWFDLGRALSQTDLDAHLPNNKKEKFAQLQNALRLSGPLRPVAAWSVRQFDSGDIRVRSRNFPTAFLLFAVGGLGSALGPTDSSDWGDVPPPVRNVQDVHESAVIGPGSDGSFRLPPPQ